MFKLKYCGYCRRVEKYLNEIFQEKPHYRQIPLEIVDEAKNRELSRQYDYYYVPTFFLDGVKVHEGAMDRFQVEQVLEMAWQSGQQAED
jgi:glutaredoxin